VDDILDLFGDDPAAARAQASALVDAMKRRRAAGTLATVLGGPFAAAGKQFSGDAESMQQGLMGAGQQRAALGVQRQRLGMDQASQTSEAAHRTAVLGETGRHNRALEGLTREELTAKTTAATTAAGAKAKADALKTAEELRKEFQMGGTYKNTQTVAESAQKILTASETGAGDLNLLYGYMRMVDPGSTVREGEFAQAASSGSLPQRIQGWATKVLNGEKLPPEVRKQFKTEAKTLLKAQNDRYEETAKPYRRLAEQSGIAPGDVVLDLGLAQMLADQGAPGAGAAPRERVFRRVNGKLVEVDP
jgi:hypothetical protein